MILIVYRAGPWAITWRGNTVPAGARRGHLTTPGWAWHDAEMLSLFGCEILDLAVAADVETTVEPGLG